MVKVLGAADSEKSGSGGTSVTVNEMVVGRVKAGEVLVPVIVTVTVPKAADAEAVSVKVEVVVPGGVTEVGTKAAVTPDGRLEAEKATAELKPPVAVTVMVEVPELPRWIVRDVGEALIEKSGAAALLK